MSFGEILAKLRKDARMSQEDLANNLNVSRQAVSKWESNSSYPETDKIIAICKLFNCSMDELMGIKEANINSSEPENKIIKSLKKYFDLFLKGLRMFYSMTFKQKISCLFELLVYSIIIIVAAAIFRGLLLEIIHKVFSMIPQNLIRVFVNIFDGIYLIVCILAFVYAIFKLYKARYLDYYDSIDNKKEIIIEQKDSSDSKKENIVLNKEKIIIRDSNNEYNPFRWVKNICKAILKFFASLGVLSSAIIFVTCIALLIITMYFVSSGPIVIYTAIMLVGIILLVYMFLELFIKFIFNRKQNYIRLFIVFFLSLLIMGVSGGLFTCELANFTIIDEEQECDYKVSEATIEMEDNLVLFLYDAKVVFEDRNDILLELYSNVENENFEMHHMEYTEEPYYMPSLKTFKVKNYYLAFADNKIDLKEVMTKFKESLKNKEIAFHDYTSQFVIHISKDNYQKLRQNLYELTNDPDDLEYYFE